MDLRGGRLGLLHTDTEALLSLTDRLLDTLLGLDAGHLHQAERQPLGCWKVAQTKQYFPALLQDDKMIASHLTD